MSNASSSEMLPTGICAVLYITMHAVDVTMALEYDGQVLHYLLIMILPMKSQLLCIHFLAVTAPPHPLPARGKGSSEMMKTTTLCMICISYT